MKQDKKNVFKWRPKKVEQGTEWFSIHFPPKKYTRYKSMNLYLLDKRLTIRIRHASRCLNSFWSDPNLVVKLWAGINHLDFIILFKIFLESVQKHVIIFLRDSWISNKKARSAFQNFGNLWNQKPIEGVLIFNECI